MKLISTALLLSAIGLVPLTAGAQGNATARDTTARDTTAKPVIAATPGYSWLGDRRQLRVGDLITIIVDEQTTANEAVNVDAHNNRKQAGSLSGQIMPAKLSSVGIGYDATSSNGGTTARAGGLSATVTARITEIEPSGVAHITGTRFVVIDGRKQEISLSGLIRSQDVGSGNLVLSSRIAEANISYKGKGISPKSGLFGKLLAAFWP